MKNIVKKGLVLLLIAVPILFLGVGSYTHSASLVDNAKSPFNDESNTGAAEDIAVIGTDDQQKDALVNVVRGVVNWVLGIMGLIALLILMYGGFLMVTAAGDEEKYKKGFTILKQAALGLILIGVAWFIASIIFWLVNQAVSNAGTASTET